MEWGSSNPHTVDEGSVPAFLIVNDMVAAIPFNGSMHSGHVWMRDHQTASIAAPNIKRQGIDGVNAPNAVGIEHETGSLLRFGIDGHVGGDSPGSLRVSGIRYRSSLQNTSIQIGSASPPVTYAGAQGSFAGLDQVVTLLPGTLAGSGQVSIVLTVDGAYSNSVQVTFK